LPDKPLVKVLSDFDLSFLRFCNKLKEYACIHYILTNTWLDSLNPTTNISKGQMVMLSVARSVLYLTSFNVEHRYDRRFFAKVH
jgi:hypothetical protein